MLNPERIQTNAAELKKTKALARSPPINDMIRCVANPPGLISCISITDTATNAITDKADTTRNIIMSALVGLPVRGTPTNVVMPLSIIGFVITRPTYIQVKAAKKRNTRAL